MQQFCDSAIINSIPQEPLLEEYSVAAHVGLFNFAVTQNSNLAADL
jgi:hypothetical protein